MKDLASDTRRPDFVNFDQDSSSLKAIKNILSLRLPFLGILLLLSQSGLFAQSATKEYYQSILDSMNSLHSQELAKELIELGESIRKDKALEGYPEVQMKIYFALAKEYGLSSRMDLTTQYGMKSISIAESIGDYAWVVEVNDMIGLSYFEFSEYDSTKKYLFRSMEVAKNNGLKNYPTTLVNMAWVNGLLDNEEEEMSYYIESLDVVEGNLELDQKGRIRAMAYGGLGDYYTRNDDFDRAEAFFEKKFSLGIETNSPVAQFEANLGLGNLYSKEQFLNVEKGEKAYFKLTKDTVNATPFIQGIGYLGLGRLYVTAEIYAKALKAFEDAYLIFSEFSSVDYHARIETEIANIHLQQGNIGLADLWVSKALENATSTSLANRERNALRVRYKIDSANSDFRAAFNNYQRFRVIDDSLKTEDSKKRIEELEVKFETEQTENENLLLMNDLAIKEADLRQKAILQTVFAVVAILLAVLLYVIYQADRRKKRLNLALERKNQLISTQKEELQFKSDKLQIINAQLKALFDFRKDLTRMIAHDMKNPLNSIIGLSSTLNEDKKVNSITKSGYQLLNLVTNMIEVEKMEEVNIDPKKEQVCLDGMVKEAREQVELLIAAKSLLFKNLLPKQLCLEGDKYLLVRVLVNLLTNAIKYSEAGDTIKIYHLNADGKLGIVVEDQGVGISTERLPFIFDKFWQNDRRSAGLATSNGLGLTYCKLAVEAHGGSIEVESELGSGTKVVFYLPYEGEVLSAVEEKPSTEASLILDSEIAVFEQFYDEIQNLKVYEVSKVKELLNTMEESGLESAWKEELLKAVYQGDEEYFQSLINAVQPLEKS